MTISPSGMREKRKKKNKWRGRALLLAGPVCLVLATSGIGHGVAEVKQPEGAARPGDAAAQVRQRRPYREAVRAPPRYALAGDQYQRAAERGDSRRHYQLGMKYFAGKGVKRNYREAMRLLTLAAEQGLAEAQYQVGLMYRRGLGAEVNFGAAAAWLRKATDQGHARAQARLGTMYAEGVGVARDDVEAYVLLSLAGERGIVAAKRRRAMVKRRLSPDQLARAEKLLAERKRQSVR